MEGHGIDMNAQTWSVSFSGSALMTWLNQVMPYADELRIFNGLYPTGEQANRTTVILWPYKNGAPARWPAEGLSVDGDGYIDPYNEGGLDP